MNYCKVNIPKTTSEDKKGISLHSKSTQHTVPN